MREIRGAIERINVPAILAFHVLARSLLAQDPIVRPARMQALDQQGLAFTVGNGDQIDLAFIFRNDAALVMLAQ